MLWSLDSKHDETQLIREKGFVARRTSTCIIADGGISEKGHNSQDSKPSER